MVAQLAFLASRPFFRPASILPLWQKFQGTFVRLCVLPGSQVDQLKCKVTSLEEECSLLRKQASTMPQREAEERGHPDAVSELWAENQRLTASLQELQGMLQVPRGAEWFGLAGGFASIWSKQGHPEWGAQGHIQVGFEGVQAPVMMMAVVQVCPLLICWAELSWRCWQCSEGISSSLRLQEKSQCRALSRSCWTSWSTTGRKPKMTDRTSARNSTPCKVSCSGLRS